MIFSINVSRKGVHYFRVELPDTSSRALAISIAEEMQQRYREVSGFKVTLTQWTQPLGTSIELSEKEKE